jgi:hypothetical protein
MERREDVLHRLQQNYKFPCLLAPSICYDITACRFGACVSLKKGSLTNFLRTL